MQNGVAELGGLTGGAAEQAAIHKNASSYAASRSYENKVPWRCRAGRTKPALGESGQFGIVLENNFHGHALG
jgi:hypothetical protein